MISTFQPRQVEPRAIRRWARQALGLLGRAFLPWSLLVTLGGLLLHFCDQLGLPGAVLCAFVSFCCYGLSVAMARACDQNQRPSWGELIPSLSEDAKDISRVTLIPTGIVAVGFSFVAFLNGFLELLARLGVLHRSGPLPPIPLPRVPDWSPMLSQLGEPFLTSVLVIGIVIPGYSSLRAMSIFMFPAMLSFGVPKDHALLVHYMQLDGGRSRGMNERSVLWLHALHMVLLCSLALLNLAFLAPIAIAFLCAMTYVAYRDIYLAQGENTKLAVRASVQLIPAAVLVSA